MVFLIVKKLCMNTVIQCYVSKKELFMMSKTFLLTLLFAVPATIVIFLFLEHRLKPDDESWIASDSINMRIARFILVSIIVIVTYTFFKRI